MKWAGRRESGNIEDRRKITGGHVAIGGGAIGLIIILIQLFLGGDPQQILNQVQQQSQTSSNGADNSVNPEEDKMAKFVSVILADNEDVWNELFLNSGQTYEEPKLVLFRNSVESGCGNAGSSAGPFYCPADHKVYIDLSFFDELQTRFGAPGDFAIAYVIAHEVGHHVQNLLGTSSKIQNMQSGASEKESNRLSVALELQADFLAGVWAHHNQKMKDIMESGDLEEALAAANAVGDDRLQKEGQGYVVPDAFTHGTSKQRMYWFKKGFDSGDVNQGNTFEGL